MGTAVEQQKPSVYCIHYMATCFGFLKKPSSGVVQYLKKKIMASSTIKCSVMVFVYYLHCLMMALFIKVETCRNIIYSTLIHNITGCFCFFNGNSVLVRFHFHFVEICPDDKSIVLLQVSSFIYTNALFEMFQNFEIINFVACLQGIFNYFYVATKWVSFDVIWYTATH